MADHIKYYAEVWLWSQVCWGTIWGVSRRDLWFVHGNILFVLRDVLNYNIMFPCDAAEKVWHVTLE